MNGGSNPAISDVLEGMLFIKTARNLKNRYFKITEIVHVEELALCKVQIKKRCKMTKMHKKQKKKGFMLYCVVF